MISHTRTLLVLLLAACAPAAQAADSIAVLERRESPLAAGPAHATHALRLTLI